MHIPDGFVDAPVALSTVALSVVAVGYSLRRAGRELGERSVPLLGVTAAFVFAAQMLNFPVAGGTSGHFMGAVLAGVLMGPWAAALVLTVVLVVQAVGMADGGITALGANVFNMAVVGGMFGYLVFVLLRKLGSRSLTGYLMAVAVAAWISIVASATAVSLQLAASGTVPLRVGLPAMVSVHMIIGLGEALITTTVVAAVLVSRPDLVRSFTLSPELARGARGTRLFGARGRLWSFVLAALVVSAALALLVSPFASSSPDGLERVAADESFEDAAQAPVWRLPPLPDYQLPGIENEALATGLAGLLGTLVLFAVVLGLGRLLGAPRRRAPATLAHGPEIHPLAGHEHTDHRPSGHDHSPHNHLPPR